MLYVHIPFCRQACHYCDFHFSTGLAQMEQMVAAIGAEAAAWAKLWPHMGPQETLYLGGGTPSLVPIPTLKGMLDQIGTHFDLTNLQELTLEANPEDVTPEAAMGWKSLGITRVSLGIQTLDDELLPTLNRAHSAAQALAAITTLRLAGIQEISIDLMFGLPGQTLEGFKADVHKMLALELPHISLYGLTLEERTVFGRRVAKGQMQAPAEDLLADMMAWLQEQLAQRGYVGYEISNYSLSGHEAVHNSGYWAGKPYLGLGPSAHSYDGQRRWHNIANNALYIKALEAGESAASEPEILSPEETFNERLLTGLRLAKGVDTNEIANESQVQIPLPFWKEVENLSNNGLILRQNDHLVLTQAGRLLADHITQKLMV